MAIQGRTPDWPKSGGGGPGLSAWIDAEGETTVKKRSFARGAGTHTHP